MSNIALRGQVVVVTGASSGIGRAAALELARLGCRVVCAARRSADLEEVAGLCRSAGGEAIAVVTDVTLEEDVEGLAAAALTRFGRIDVWVNNAGTTHFARLADGPFHEHRRVIETNVLGTMLGARAAIRIFRCQHRGVLINVGSILSKVGQPFVPSYAASKFAVRGISESLRSELADEAGIHVCTLLPYTIDTPHFQSGGNEVGVHARALPPIQSPEKIAQAIVSLITHPRRELHVPRLAVLGLVLRWAFPETTDRLLLHALRRWHFDEVRERPSSGSMYAPRPDEPGQIHGQRTPQLGTIPFVGWLLADLVGLQPQRADPEHAAG